MGLSIEKLLKDKKKLALVVVPIILVVTVSVYILASSNKNEKADESVAMSGDIKEVEATVTKAPEITPEVTPEITKEAKTDDAIAKSENAVNVEQVSKKRDFVLLGEKINEKIISDLTNIYTSVRTDSTLLMRQKILNEESSMNSLKKGENDMALLNRSLTEEEKSQGIEEYPICYDALVVVVNKKNPVKNLSMDNIKNIFSDKVNNWSQLGWNDAIITKFYLSRSDSEKRKSLLFGSITGLETIEENEIKSEIKEAIGKDDYVSLRREVSHNINSVGFIGFKDKDSSVSAIAIDGIEATKDNIMNKQYHLSRYYAIAIRKDSTDEAKDFVKYITGEIGQKAIGKTYLPVN